MTPTTPKNDAANGKDDADNNIHDNETDNNIKDNNACPYTPLKFVWGGGFNLKNRNWIR